MTSAARRDDSEETTVSETTVRVSRENGQLLPLKVRRCGTFVCRLRGLTFRRRINEDEALLFVEATESRLGTAIHMAFVFFPIGVVWLNRDGIVVDKAVARPFRPYYAPRAAAKYFVEGPPVLVEWVTIGERLLMEPADGLADRHL